MLGLDFCLSDVTTAYPVSKDVGKPQVSPWWPRARLHFILNGGSIAYRKGCWTEPEGLGSSWYPEASLHPSMGLSYLPL